MLVMRLGGMRSRLRGKGNARLGKLIILVENHGEAIIPGDSETWIPMYSILDL